MTLRVAPCRRQDIPALLEFIGTHFPTSPLKADQGFFDWRFGKNPAGSALESTYLVLWSNDEIVGQLATIADHIWCGDRWHDAIWIVDLMLRSDHRSGDGALMLFRAVGDLRPVVLATGVSPHLTRLYRALGWRRKSIGRVCFAPLRPSAIVRRSLSGRSRRIFDLPAVARTVDSLASLSFAFRRLVRGRSSRVVVSATAGLHFDVDALQSRALRTFQVTSFRGPSYLEWKFTDRPFGELTFLAARSGSTVTGYLVIKWMERDGIPWGEVADYLCSADDLATFEALMLNAERSARLRGVGFIRARVSLSRHLAILRPPLWLARRKTVEDDVFLRCQDPELLRQLLVAEWHLTGIAADRVDYGRDEPTSHAHSRS